MARTFQYNVRTKVCQLWVASSNSEEGLTGRAAFMFFDVLPDTADASLLITDSQFQIPTQLMESLIIHFPKSLALDFGQRREFFQSVVKLSRQPVILSAFLDCTLRFPHSAS